MMMKEIWIIDDDIDFVRRFKLDLSTEFSKLFSEKIKIKTIYDFFQFEKDFSKSFDEEDRPLFIFLNPFFKKQNYLSHYIDIIKNQSTWIHRICLMSTQAFGSIDHSLKEFQIKNSLFLHKLRVHYDLKDILKKIEIPQSDQNGEDKLKLDSFKKRRSVRDIKNINDEIEDHLYEKLDKEKMIDLIKELDKKLLILEIDYHSSMKKLNESISKNKNLGELKLKKLIREVLEWLNEMGLKSEDK